MMRTAQRLGYPQELGSALDFGCGVGRLAPALAKRFQTYYGVDIAASMIDGAQRYHDHLTSCYFIVNREDNLRILGPGSDGLRLRRGHFRPPGAPRGAFRRGLLRRVLDTSRISRRDRCGLERPDTARYASSTGTRLQFELYLGRGRRPDFSVLDAGDYRIGQTVEDCSWWRGRPVAGDEWIGLTERR